MTPLKSEYVSLVICRLTTGMVPDMTCNFFASKVGKMTKMQDLLDVVEDTAAFPRFDEVVYNCRNTVSTVAFYT